MAIWFSKRVKDGSLTSVLGFRVAAVACGLKPNDALDLALVTSTLPCSAAGVFTTNAFKAAPVLYDQDIVAGGKPIHAVVINSGCANACTGEQGMADAKDTAGKAADLLGFS